MGISAESEPHVRFAEFELNLRTRELQANGRKVDTIEGLSDSGEIADLQGAFHRHNALQCGFCTPGMLMSAQELLAGQPEATREEIRAHMAGNYCRCTGYQAIVDALEEVLAARREARQ